MGQMMRVLLAAVPLVALASCGQQKVVYPMAPEAAQAALVGTKIPAIAFGMAMHSGPAQASDDGVAWYLQGGDGYGGGRAGQGGNTDVMKLVAKLTPSGTGTQVDVDVQPAAAASSEAFDKMISQRPAIANMFRSIVKEQVDAALTGRKFSFANIRQDMAVAMVSMMPEARKQMDDAGAQFERQDREKVHDAYRAAGQSDPVADNSGAGSNPWR